MKFPRENQSGLSVLDASVKQVSWIYHENIVIEHPSFFPTRDTLKPVTKVPASTLNTAKCLELAP